MAFDGAFLHVLCTEISEQISGTRIDKVYQPSRNEIVLTMRSGGKNLKLLISADASHPRMHFTETELDNPPSPPMFCMLLRKHIGNAKILEIRQQGLERVVVFDLETRNEFGDLIVVKLVVEIMGRHSNIILVNENGKVIDSVKRVDDSVSSLRRILPGVKYEAVPTQDKLSMLEYSSEELIKQMKLRYSQFPLSKALLSTMEGVSPLICREVSFLVSKDSDVIVYDLTEEGLTRLDFYLKQLQNNLSQPPVPTMILDSGKKPIEFYFTKISQYTDSVITREYETLSLLLDDFFVQKDTTTRISQKAHDILRFLINTSEKISRKLENQRKELRECADRDILRIYGDLLNANLYKLEKGDRVAELENFYDESLQIVKIKLDPLLTPSQNAQKYYKDYKKLDTAEKMLTQLIKKGEEEQIYIDSVFDMLTRASTEAEISAIRAELVDSGYLRASKNQHQKSQKLSYIKYKSSDGFTILCGRNNLQNDRLTLKESSNLDMWLHTQKIPGSHTVIVSEGNQIPDTTIEEAAMVAAHNSKARGSTKVAVDYTLIRNIKKPNGSKPGFVVYDTYNTLLITPDEDKINLMLQKQ